MDWHSCLNQEPVYKCISLLRYVTPCFHSAVLDSCVLNVDLKANSSARASKSVSGRLQQVSDMFEVLYYSGAVNAINFL
jgi:hypothetical protein